MLTTNKNKSEIETLIRRLEAHHVAVQYGFRSEKLQQGCFEAAVAGEGSLAFLEEVEEDAGW